MTVQEGKLFVYGDHINTDLIIPTAYLSGSREEMGKHCLQDLDPQFVSEVCKGDIVAAGENFGCGSTKDGSGALLGAGISCVIAKSFGRIFFRNAINAGLMVIECPAFVEDAQRGHRARVDFANNLITNLTTGKTYSIPDYPPFVRRLIEAGGIMNLAKETGLDGLWNEVS